MIFQTQGFTDLYSYFFSLTGALGLDLLSQEIVKSIIKQEFSVFFRFHSRVLGLVVNAIVLWNTYYMDAALNHLRSESMVIHAEDISRLSPLGYQHINILGRYHFNLPDDLKNGAMRPLRDKSDFDQLNEQLL